MKLEEHTCIHMHKGEKKSLSKIKRNNIHNALEIFGQLRIRRQEDSPVILLSCKMELFISSVCCLHMTAFSSLFSDFSFFLHKICIIILLNVQNTFPCFLLMLSTPETKLLSLHLGGVFFFSVFIFF